MAIESLVISNWSDTSTFPTEVASESAVRSALQTIPNEIVTHINSTVHPAIEACANTAYTDTPAAVASGGAPGISATYARGDHTHEGVHSVNGAKGDVTVSRIASAASSPAASVECASSGKIVMSPGNIVLSGTMFGSTLPTQNVSYGQLFFKIY